MTRQAVCISHTTGANGSAVGRAVAERLGFRYADDEVISEAAEWAELDPALVADVERRKSFGTRLLGEMAAGKALEPTPTGEYPRKAPADADVRALIRAMLRSLAERGSVVIVSHAASFALAGNDVLRVFVTASDATRTRRVAESSGTDEREAVKQLKREDKARADYLKRFYGVDRELPTHYDIVINTDVLTADAAAEVIASAAG